MRESMMTSVGNYRFHSCRWDCRWGCRRENAEGGPLPLLLLHGFMGCGEDFAAVVQCLGRLPGDLDIYAFDIYALDLPGHGQTRLENSHQLTDYGMAETAQGVRGWTQRIQPGPWAIAGYSMGGRLALYLAAHFPEVFPVTVAIAASPGLERQGDRDKRQALDHQRALTLDASKTPEQFEQFLERWYQMPLFSNLATHPNFATMLTRRRRNNPQHLAHSLRYLGLGQQPFLTPALARYPVQLRLVVGEYDRKFIGLNQAIARQCPRAQLTLIPNSGHTIPLENPTALAQVFADTLAAAI